MSDDKPQTEYTGNELCRLPARHVVDLLKKGEVSPQETIAASKERTHQVNGPVNAMVTECFDRAEERASTHLPDHAKHSADNPGWLAGLPVGIKDLSAVEGVRTTMGTKGMANNVATESSAIVDIIEHKGGLVVGKTNTPEEGAGGNTFNEVFGYTRNPWDTSKNAGGSSGGAAVSLATGEVWLSQGSDLAGSLRTPAAYCGVVGFRPTPGRAFGGPAKIGFSGEGISGPMARDVQDCALFLDNMAGFDERAPISLPAPLKPFQQSVVEADPKIRIAYSPTLNGFAPVEAEIDSVMRQALNKAEGRGATVGEACPNLDGLYDTYITLRALAWASGPGRGPEEIQKHYKKTLTENIEVGRNLTVDQIIDANVTRTTLFHSVRTFLHDYDVLACAVVGLEPTPVEVEYPSQVAGQTMESYVDWLRFSFLSTTTGLPAVSVPCGFTKSGMPVGIQLIGRPQGDAALLAAARVIEQAVDLGSDPIDPAVRHQ